MWMLDSLSTGEISSMVQFGLIPFIRAVFCDWGTFNLKERLQWRL